MSILNRLRNRRAEPEPTAVEPDPTPSSSGCGKCSPAPFNRGPKFGGTILARGRGLPHDPGLQVL